MSPKAFSKYSGLTIDRVYKLGRQGKLRLLRLGASTIVDVDHGMDYLQNLADWRESPTSHFGGSRMPPRWRNRK
jgi:hypothetical protein